jgi:hypothetical protein
VSSGHSHAGGYGLDTGQLDRLLRNEEVRECLFRPFTVNRDCDVPYIAGYSTDGETIYIDRHLPETIKFEIDGKKYELDPTPFLLTHERTEKALIDALGYGYSQAHRVATAAERRQFMQHHGPGIWVHYQAAMDKYAKYDEHEKLQKPPKDLDMTPYEASPVNKALLAHLEKAMGKPKVSKEESEYDATGGKPSKHCGPDAGWPKGYCSMYREEHKCTKVRGWIAHRGHCKYWDPA